MQTVAQAEAQVDAQLAKLDQMDKEELEEMEALRARRLQKLKNASARKQIGHGEYTEIGGHGNEKEFFDAAKASDKLVVHFYRNSTPRCAVVDMHLQKLAVTHPGTRFCKINAEQAPFLAERLRIIFLPTICCVIKGKVKDYVVGFDELGGTDEFDTEVLEWRLGIAGVLHYEGALEGPPDPNASKSGRRGFVGKEKKNRATRAGWESDSDEDF